jgi:hypothetical protein
MKNTLVIIILGLMGVIFFMRECAPDPPTPDPIIITDIQIKTDTFWKDSPIYPPIIRWRDTGSTKIIIKDLTEKQKDSLLADYLSNVFYKDTILSDSTAFIVVMIPYTRIG